MQRGYIRVFLYSQADGAQWELGARLGTPVTGRVVPCHLAGVEREAEGGRLRDCPRRADRERRKRAPTFTDPHLYARSLQRDKADGTSRCLVAT